MSWGIAGQKWALRGAGALLLAAGAFACGDTTKAGEKPNNSLGGMPVNGAPNAGSSGVPSTQGGGVGHSGSGSGEVSVGGGTAVGGTAQGGSVAPGTAGSTDAGSDSGGAASTSSVPSCADETGVECHDESCCTSIALPGGMFQLGDESDFSAQPEHAASISAYALDKYEVTVARFRRFVAHFGSKIPKGAGAVPKIPGSGWEDDGFVWMHPSWGPADADALKTALACDDLPTWTDEPGASEEKPINCVTWWEAFAFCAWDGGRLPTEAEWEYAATGGSENRPFPWGSAPLSIERLSYNAAFGGTPGTANAADIPAVGSTPMGSGRWGHADLAGSVEEWVRDSYSANYYAGTGNECNDCALILNESADRVKKGGSWFSLQPSIAEHLPANRSTRSARRGLRCARNL